MKDCDKNKESLFLKYWSINNLYAWAISQKDFKWVEHTSQFNEDFIENWNEDNDEGYFLEADV